MKKTLFLLAAVVAAISMSAANYDLYVGGVRVTDDNKNNITGSNIKAYNSNKAYSVVYNNIARTLTLTNVKIERTGSGNRAIQNNGVDGLTIIFNGANYLKAEDQGTVKLDKATTIKSAGGRYDETAIIVAGDKDGLCVFNGAKCTIKNANLRITGMNSDAVWGDTKKEQLRIEDSHVYIFSNSDNGRAIYNFASVEMENSYVRLSAKQASQCLYNVTAFNKPDNMIYRNGVEARFTTVNGSGQLVISRGTFARSEGIVMENYVAKVDASYFPDPKFRQFIEDQGYADDGYLFDSDLKEETQMEVNNLGISDLTGIEYFRWLTYLWCGNNNLTSLNVENNTKLTTLWCEGNKLTSLNVANNTALGNLGCNYNQLSSLSLTNNTALRVLACESNKLTSLNVANCPDIYKIHAYGNKLSGAAMTSFINSLPTRSGYNELRLVYHSDDNEENLITNADIKAASSKGWTVRHSLTTTSNDDWLPTDECVYYDLYVGGTQIHSCVNHIDNVEFDRPTKTLTLNNADLTGPRYNASDPQPPYGSGIYSKLEGLTINVKGDNTVKGYYNSGVADGNSGLNLSGTTTIEGDGTLSASGYNGIFSSSGDLTVKESVKLTASGTVYGIYGNGTLTVQDEASITASNTIDGNGGPIYKWKALSLLSGQKILEPKGATHSNGTIYDSKGSVIYSGTVKIGQPYWHKPGDVNEDDEINTSDVVAIYNYIIDGTASGILKDYADVDGDGEVGTADVVAVYNIIINGE